MKEYGKKLLGWGIIFLGLAIALTPLTPGSVLLLVGAEMVFGDWPEWKRLKDKIRNRFWKV